jgi:hypothetical protein
LYYYRLYQHLLKYSLKGIAVEFLLQLAEAGKGRGLAVGGEWGKDSEQEVACH